MQIPPLLFILIVLAAALGFETVRSLLSAGGNSRTTAARKRLRELVAPLQTEKLNEASLLRNDKAGSLYARLLTELPFADALALQLYRSGLTITVSRFVGISLAMGAAGAIAATAFLQTPYAPALGLLAGGAPYLHIRRLGAKRMTAFEEQFADALDLLIRAMRAGHSFSVGLQMVGEELPDPVGREFALVADEIQLGMTARAALANLVRRVNVPDLPFFVVAVTLQQETGSNLAEVLGNLAGVIRERFKLYGKVRALTAMGRASANLLAVWPLVMVGALNAVNPDYIKPLWETTAGHNICFAALAMTIFGYIVCRRMATIEV